MSVARAHRFPTATHAEVAASVVDFFRNSPAEAVLLVNSCARGAATPESDIDVAVLVSPRLTIEDRLLLDSEWRQRYQSAPLFREFEKLGPFSLVHLDLFDGCMEPQHWDDGGGPDAFEIELGNRVAYAAPLWERSGAFADLRRRWLPYYGESLREKRLAMVVEACRRDLDRLRVGLRRGLYFYSFDRLYHAFQEFLQALFIARRVYPIAYDKWVREQVEGWLGLPELYAELPLVLQFRQLESGELLLNAEHLSRLLDRWVVPQDSSPQPQNAGL